MFKTLLATLLVWIWLQNSAVLDWTKPKFPLFFAYNDIQARNRFYVKLTSVDSVPQICVFLCSRTLLQDSQRALMYINSLLGSTYWSSVQTSWAPAPGSVWPAGRCAAAGPCSAAAAGGLEPEPPAEPWPPHSAGPSTGEPAQGEVSRDGRIKEETGTGAQCSVCKRFPRVDPQKWALL